MSEDLNQYVSEEVNNLIDWVALRCVALSWIELSWRCVEVRWGEVRWVSEREGQREGESEQANEWVWCMGAENDHFVNVRSSLDRVLTTQFDWLEVSLIETVLSTFSQISYHLLLFVMTSHDIIWFQVWIWFEHPYACTSYVCHFNDNTLPLNISTVH